MSWGFLTSYRLFSSSRNVGKRSKFGFSLRKRTSRQTRTFLGYRYMSNKKGRRKISLRSRWSRNSLPF